MFTFRCAACDKDRRLEVVYSDAIVSDEIIFITSGTEFETGVRVMLDSHVERFQCYGCGHIVAEDTDALDEWLKEIGHVA